MGSKGTTPMVKDISVYAQTFNTVYDERDTMKCRNTDFLTEQEEKWYQETLEKYREEFGLRPCEK